MDDFAMSDESPSNDLKIIEDIGKDHDALIGIIQRRAGSIKAILNYWQNGSIGSAINALNMINDPCVTMDVLNNTFSKNLRIEMLNFEYVTQLLPHAQQLVNSKYETHIMASISSTSNILKYFAPKIVRNKRGEDKKCDACVEQFKAFRNCRGFKKALGRGGEVATAS